MIMSTHSLKPIHDKLKHLPESLLKDVENYIDFLAFKYEKQQEDVPQWQKDVLDKRLDSYHNNPDDVLPIETLFEILDEDV